MTILKLGIGPHYGAKVVVVDLLLICHHEVAPPLLAGLALHFVLVDGGGRVELGEVGLQVLVDLVIHLCETQRRALDFLENSPVCGHVLHGWRWGQPWCLAGISEAMGTTFHSELLLDLEMGSIIALKIALKNTVGDEGQLTSSRFSASSALNFDGGATDMAVLVLIQARHRDNAPVIISRRWEERSGGEQL